MTAFSSFEKRSMNCAKKLAWCFLPLPLHFAPNGCLSIETLFKSSIFLVLTALTGIVGPVHAPMFLAQCTAFLEPHLFRDTVVRGTTTLALTFLALSGGFLGTFLFGLFLGIGICYYFSTFSRTPNSFLTLWGSESCMRLY